MQRERETPWSHLCPQKGKEREWKNRQEKGWEVKEVRKR